MGRQNNLPGKNFLDLFLEQCPGVQQADFLGADHLAHQGFVKGMVMPGRTGIAVNEITHRGIEEGRLGFGEKGKAANVPPHLGKILF